MHQSGYWRALAWAACACIGVVPGAAAEPSATAPVHAAASSLTLADWREDLAFAREEMPRRHANLFHTLSRTDYEAAFDRFEADAAGLAPHEIIVRLAGIVAAVGDGHTRLTLPMDPAAGYFSGHTGTDPPRVPAFHQFPLRLSRATDGYVITRTDEAHREMLGTRLVAVDGHTPAEIEARLGPVVHRDNANQLHYLLPQFTGIPEVMHARGVTVNLQRSNWRVERSDGRTWSVDVAPLALGTHADWVELEPGKDRFGPASAEVRNLWFISLTRPSGIYVRLAEIADDGSRSFEAFAAELHQVLATTSQRRLIVDLRGNPGGDNGLNASLIRALIRTPWVSEPGALFVLVNSGTFSAAMNLAEDLERWFPAVFVGDGTGGRPNSYGDARKVVLPRSGLTIRLSSLYWQNHPRDERPAIEPLISAPVTIADLRAGRDPALAVLATLDDGSRGVVGAWAGRLAVPYQHVPMTLVIPAADSDRPVIAGIPALGVESATIRPLEPTGEAWVGELTLTMRTAVVAARPSGQRLVGWVEYRGNRYPFVLERQ